ncbi:mitochondrial ribosomal death-associated protein 3-domain-containing protein [Xylariaceae sp. FL0016]|nr:mitochondrial ribosomal death-associated protein 3-domain-containing protein [Xylariaceae sp. FL0016]
MASSNCWRCLSRPSQRLLAPASRHHVAATAPPSITASFSTSAQLAAKEVKEPSMSRHIRRGKNMILGKKKRQPDKGKPPQPGERKAFRKRIQLSNDNALVVKGHQEMSAQNMVDPDAIGQMVELPEALQDQLRTCEAFKPIQSFSLFRKPHLLIRNETVDMAKQITHALENKETLRLVLTGERGTGKSILGLQALATGFLNKAVVINIPEGQELTTGATEYSVIPHSKMFSLPVYTVKLMQAIHATNHHILSKHKVEGDYINLPISVPRNMTLAGLLSATKEPEFAPPVFQAFWNELTLPGRPPIVFALDGLSHIMRVSDYRSPAFELIHSHDLNLVRMFTDALGGKTKFPNGAAIVAMTAKRNGLHIPSMEKAIEQAGAAQAGKEIPPRDPFFAKYDERVFEALKGVRLLDVKGVSKMEARALMEYWAASGILRLRVDEQNVSEKWTLAGGGMLAEMERVSLFDIRVQ